MLDKSCVQVVRAGEAPKEIHKTLHEEPSYQERHKLTAGRPWFFACYIACM